MKQVKKTILFSLALGSSFDATSQAGFEFSYELLYALVPFEPVSIRGAVGGLRDASLVSVYQRDGQTKISLTSVGREALRSMFPALRSNGGRRDQNWTVCLFLEGKAATKSDPQIFRGVRQSLLENGFFPLERGMYVLPRSIAGDLIPMLGEHKALDRCLVFETRRMLNGDERSIIRTFFDIRTIQKKREHILKTLDNLAKKVSTREKLYPQTREAFISLIPKLMDFCLQDLTVPEVYFPQEIKLSDTKEAIFSVSAEILPKLLLHLS